MKKQLGFLTLGALAALSGAANAQNTFPANGYVGVGTTAPAGGVHVKTSPSWSGHNFGPCLVVDGPRNNAIALLDSNSSNPWAIVNAGGLFSVATMPSLGNVSSPPGYLLNVLPNGNVGIGTTAPAVTLDVNGSARFGRTHIDHADLSLDSDYGIFSPGNLYLETTGTMFLNALPGQGSVQVGGPGAAGNLSVAGVISAAGGFKFSNGATLSSTGVGADLSGSLPNPTISAGAVTANKIANLAVNTAKIGDLAVTTAKLADGSVNTPKIADASINDTKIVNLSWSKLFGQPTSFPPNGAAGGDLTGTYPNPFLAVNTVTAAKLATDVNSLTKVSGGVMITSPGAVDVFGSLSLKTASNVLRVKLQDINAGGGIGVYSPSDSSVPIADVGFVLGAPTRASISVNYGGVVKAQMYVDPSGNGVITATTVAQTSDRNMKENFSSVSPREVLDKVASLPVSRWNFKGDTATQHLGPMAQDFYEAFHLGMDDKHIATVDENGVALAAIQGLNEKMDSEISTLRAENLKLRQFLKRLEQVANLASRREP